MCKPAIAQSVVVPGGYLLEFLEKVHDDHEESDTRCTHSDRWLLLVPWLSDCVAAALESFFSCNIYWLIDSGLWSEYFELTTISRVRCFVRLKWNIYVMYIVNARSKCGLFIIWLTSKPEHYCSLFRSPALPVESLSHSGKHLPHQYAMTHVTVCTHEITRARDHTGFLVYLEQTNYCPIGSFLFPVRECKIFAALC